MDATPRPTARPLVYAPGAGAISGLRALSTSHLPALSPSPSPPKFTDDTPRIVRKQSGQVVKSSLKSSAPRVRGSLEVVVSGGGAGAGSSKSAPSTPTAGSRARVHFDSRLEHVKLFLAEQKPLAVSRDGSPTDDTSATDSDFPDFIFGRARERERAREEEGRLEMLAEVPPAAGQLDVKLQTFALAADRTSVAGTVAVRNLAFDKWVAVRFTLDNWQTTSEVAARYSHSLGAVDLFAFSIRLTDVLARIEGKEMMVAVRFSCAGREMWDNNGGRNYRATFRRVRDRDAKKEEDGAMTTPKPEGEVTADLRNRLERVVKTQEQERSASFPLRGAEAPAAATVGFRAGGSLAARYDFDAAARAPHLRARSHPIFDSPSPPSTNAVPWPRASHNQKPRPVLGSPRDAAEEGVFRPAPYVASDSEDAPFKVPTRGRPQRGYFDVPLRDLGSFRLSPDGTVTPLPLSSPGRCNSFPPLDPRAGLGLGLGLGLTLPPRGAEPTSEDSTPSLFGSEASLSSETTSPVSPPDFAGLETMAEMSVSASPATYHSFLDRFCFYTGSGLMGIGAETLPRTQSVSSVEEFLSAASASPRIHAFVARQAQASVTPPLRFDDSASEASTPTTSASFPTTPESRSATSVVA
ncbi:carbohydrate-binding module family 21 protein [Mycena pura]|uniref:Carbohydrate-binding module family 21 protein n=1 Tax=Mycena pura TaxID=153505 RepID=A0AAD6VVW1_9AGAR|nr:carbohydrate-binding module family 21 protein [Mycena pura]